MSARTSVRLLDHPVLQVWDVRCRARASRPGQDEHPKVTQVILPLDGVFEVHRGDNSAIADPTSVVLFEEGSDHRIAHPTDQGDRCLVLVYPQETAAEAIEPGTTFGGPVDPGTSMSARALAAGLRRNTLSVMEAEENAMRLLGHISADLGRTRGYRQPSRHQVLRIQQARAHLAADPARRWRLDELARIVHSSPFHLARQFRNITGISVSRYLLHLRLTLAAQRLADGADDLAALATDLGFADHSHFTKRFRSVFDMPPSAARRALHADEPSKMSTFIQANTAEEL